MLLIQHRKTYQTSSKVLLFHPLLPQVIVIRPTLYYPLLPQFRTLIQGRVFLNSNYMLKFSACYEFVPGLYMLFSLIPLDYFVLHLWSSRMCLYPCDEFSFLSVCGGNGDAVYTFDERLSFPGSNSISFAINPN